MKNLFVIACLFILVTVGYSQDLSETQQYNPLTERQPTLEQLEAYLVQFTDGSNFRWYENPFHYIDLNGDGELDLVAEGHMHVTVMLWLGHQYNEPYQRYIFGSPRNPYSKVEFADWTFDGTPEVVFHNRTAYSGSDIGGDVFRDSIIHCTLSECHVIWEEVVFDNYNGYSMDGRWIQQMTIQHTVDMMGIPQLQTITTEFVYGCAYDCSLKNDLPVPEGQYFHTVRNRVGAVIQKDYFWNGYDYQLQSEKRLYEPYFIEFQNENSALSQTDAYARLDIESVSVGYPWGEFPQCQLSINNIKFGEPFICNQATISWTDMTGDGNEELIIEAYAGFSGVQEGETECAHQRLIGYQSIDKEFIQIANITGCLSQIDMFGLRMENLDDDSALEIVSAGDLFVYDEDPCMGMRCWYEPNHINEIYDWNGTEYDFSHTVSREPYKS